jgi:hypothetical protein
MVWSAKIIKLKRKNKITKMTTTSVISEGPSNGFRYQTKDTLPSIDVAFYGNVLRELRDEGKFNDLRPKSQKEFTQFFREINFRVSEIIKNNCTIETRGPIVSENKITTTKINQIIIELIDDAIILNNIKFDQKFMCSFTVRIKYLAPAVAPSPDDENPELETLL